MADFVTREALETTFSTYGRPKEEWLIGGEFERHLLDPSGQPLGYATEPGIRWLLTMLRELDGYAPYHERDNLIALFKDQHNVTLEPGGQFELSGSPFKTIAEVIAEARAFHDRVDEFLSPHGFQQVALGYTPFAKLDHIEWMPKGRYVIMREYLAATGGLAHAMMKGTCALQANFDYLDEEDCAAKVKLSTLLSPLITAIFANSPLKEGQLTGYKTYRGHIWTQVDDDRAGFPTKVRDGFTFERWLDYLLDVPMMFYKEGDHWLPAKGRTFRTWMEDGINGQFPTWKDWELHMTSVFPEVRVKRTIEIRGADCVPLDLAAGFLALFEGLLYCKQATDEALDLAAEFARQGTMGERFDAACHGGLSDDLGGRKMAGWAQDLLDIAWRGVGRCNPEDQPWLAPLKGLVDSGRCPADLIIDAFHADPSPRGILRQARYLGDG